MVRKVALGTRAPISLGRLVLGADPGQGEKNVGSGAAATAPGESVPQPVCPRFAGPAGQGKRARANQRGAWDESVWEAIRACGRKRSVSMREGLGV